MGKKSRKNVPKRKERHDTEERLEPFYDSDRVNEPAKHAFTCQMPGTFSYTIGDRVWRLENGRRYIVRGIEPVGSQQPTINGGERQISAVAHFRCHLAQSH